MDAAQNPWFSNETKLAIMESSQGVRFIAIKTASFARLVVELRSFPLKFAQCKIQNTDTINSVIFEMVT